MDDDELYVRAAGRSADDDGHPRAADRRPGSSWPDGFAEYGVGHLDRVERIEAALAEEAPGVAVAGAAYRGLGIPACIRQGRGGDAAHDQLSRSGSGQLVASRSDGSRTAPSTAGPVPSWNSKVT